MVKILKRVISIDDREPEVLIEYIKFWVKAHKLKVDVVVERRKIYDVAVIVIYEKEIKDKGNSIVIKKYKKSLGLEIKRIISDDARQSIYSGRLKDQVERMPKDKTPSMIYLVGNLDDLKTSDKKALLTIKAQMKLLGVCADTVESDYWLAFEIVQMCNYYSENKKIVFRAYCNVVKIDDSTLTKSIKQYPNIGDFTAEVLGEMYGSPREMFEIIPPSISKCNEMALELSNIIRVKKEKSKQKKPLKVIKDYVYWFFGIEKSE
jgi:ERCC4-type nuclease